MIKILFILLFPCFVSGQIIRANGFYVPTPSSIIYMTATGGTITTGGNYKVHTFTSSGTFIITQLGSIGQVDALIIAGGGSGSGYGGGGGGAGGMQDWKSTRLNSSH